MRVRIFHTLVVSGRPSGHMAIMVFERDQVWHAWSRGWGAEPRRFGDIESAVQFVADWMRVNARFDELLPATLYESLPVTIETGDDNLPTWNNPGNHNTQCWENNGRVLATFNGSWTTE